MNKNELINQIAESADICKKAVGDALRGLMMEVSDTMVKEDNLW